MHEQKSPSQAWWKELTPYHWFVFAMASAAWLFDCLDQQIFLLFRQSALEHLMPDGTDMTVIKKFGGYATSIFVMGWATGGLIFGSLGDRFGRARMLTVTVLLYSLFTGLSALSVGWLDFAIYRFITGLGVGGVFGLAVALVADTLPDRARPGALGLLQALSAVGNITAGLISMWMGGMIKAGTVSAEHSWKFAFLIGAVPAFLCVFIQMRLKEPEKWVKARAASASSGSATKLGSYVSLLGMERWRHGP
jgi:MFS family permease